MHYVLRFDETTANAKRSRTKKMVDEDVNRVKAVVDLNSDQIFLGMVSMQYKAKTVFFCCCRLIFEFFKSFY